MRVPGVANDLTCGSPKNGFENPVVHHRLSGYPHETLTSEGGGKDADFFMLNQGHRNRRWNPVQTTLVIVFAIHVVFGAPIQHTDAVWADVELSKASLNAMTVPAPLPQPGANNTCSIADRLTLSPKVVIQWQVPQEIRETGAPYYLVVGSNPTVLGSIGNLLAGSGVSTASTNSEQGYYTTTLSGNVVSGLLDFVTGGSSSIGLYLSFTQYNAGTWATSWKSEPLKFTVKYEGLTLVCNSS